jgi:hypothetical protein
MNKKSLRVESSIYYQYLPPEVLEWPNGIVGMSVNSTYNTVHMIN